MTNNLMSRVNAFGRNVKAQGNTGLRLIVDVIEHYRDHNDWTPAARLLKKLSGTTDFDHVKRLMGVAMTNVTVKKDNGHKEGFVFSLKKDTGKVVSLSNHYAILAEGAETGESFRSQKLWDLVKPMQKEVPAEIDWTKKGQEAAKRLAKLNPSPANVIMFLRAMKEQMEEELKDEDNSGVVKIKNGDEIPF